MGLFSGISKGLKKTRDALVKSVEILTGTYVKLDDEFFEELEETLIMGDVGINTSMKICERVKALAKERGISDTSGVLDLIKEVVSEMLDGEHELNISTTPSVVLIIGVNGVGKTTTIGKLAHNLKSEGKNVLLAAADTFRAAAIDQLNIWAERADVPIIKHGEGADPAAVIFDAIAAGKARNSDVIICDTAGRLHNKKNLMNELSKISRVIFRECPDAAVEVLLVLDATTGQNALNQAREFKEAAGLTGIVLTKLDGTARGGVVIGIIEELSVPVKFIGVGEQMEDLRKFNPREFSKALFSDVNTERVEEESDVIDSGNDE